MIYFDNSATTRVFDEAAEAAHKYMTGDFYNPAAAYSPAVAAEREVNAARARLAAVIGADKSEIVYTSGGTESNNMAVSGALMKVRSKGRVIVSEVEHPSVYITAHALNGFDVVDCGVDGKGRLSLEELDRLLTPETQLVSVMLVNNETGAINDIPAAYRLIKRRAPNALMHVDGVQGFIKVPFDARYCDLFSLSGHKFHAPKGVGALYIKNGAHFSGGQTGGGQEGDRRSGTLNTPGIMGMDAAIRKYTENRAEYIENMYAVKERLYNELMKLPDTVLNGPAVSEGAPHILNVSFLGVRGEVLLHALEEREIYVSTGSACSAHKKGRNRILSAMGVSGERQEGAIRFSLCPMNTVGEADAAAEAIGSIVEKLRKYRRR